MKTREHGAGGAVYDRALFLKAGNCPPVRKSVPHQYIMVNLEPADVKKEGSAFDLPMAVGVLGGHVKRGPIATLLADR